MACMRLKVGAIASIAIAAAAAEAAAAVASCSSARMFQRPTIARQASGSLV